MDEVLYFLFLSLLYELKRTFLGLVYYCDANKLHERHGMFWIPVILYDHRHLIRSHEMCMLMTPDVSFLMYPTMHYFGTPRHT